MTTMLRQLLILVAVLSASTNTLADTTKPPCMDRKVETEHDLDISSSFNELLAITANNQTTLAVGIDTLLSSKNGTDWSRHESDEYFVDALWDGHRFVALTVDGKLYVADSDGSSWTQLSSIGGEIGYFRKIVFNGEIYLTVSDKEDASVTVSYSDNALDWKTEKINGYHHYGATNIIWSGTEYYLGPSSKSVMDDYTFKYKNKDWHINFVKKPLSAFLHDGKKIVVVSAYTIYHGENGKDLKKIVAFKEVPSINEKLDTCCMRTMAYANQRYFIGAGCGTFFSSQDGTEWEMYTADSEAIINDLIWNGREYLAVGGRYGHGMIFKSNNGRQWTPLYEANGDITVIKVKQSP